jgi:YqjK-like protein
VKRRALELAQRREALVARSSAQRHEVAAAAAEITARLDRIDQRIEAVRRFFRRPWLLAGAVAAALVLLGPRKLLQIVSRSAFLFSTAQRVAQLVRG